MKKSKSSKHILIVNNGLAGGGIERASVSLANYFESKGYTISVIALYKSEPFFQLNQNIQFYEPAFDRSKINKYFYLIKMMLFLRRKVKEIQPDTILAFSEWTNPFVILALKGVSIPLFISDRMNPLAKLPFISEILRKLFYKTTNGIIAQSNFAKSILEKKTKSKSIHVIYNPVNAIERLDCTIEKHVVSVGRLESVKGHLFLIEAFAKVKDSTWSLHLVGDGSLRKSLEERCITLGIAERVYFYGHLLDFRSQLSSAQIFVLPSLKEGFPNALIEAMSVPLACIASDTFNGFHEIVSHRENGILVTPGNVAQLSAALNELIENEALRKKLAHNAFEVRKTLHFDTIAQHYLAIILAA